MGTRIGIKIASIGAIGYSDFSNYVLSNGMPYALNRRKIYRIRHKNDINVIGSAGYYANKILWS